MAVTIKSEREIDLMRQSCRLLEEVHDELGRFVRPGISTLDIDRYGDQLIRERGGIPNFLNYNGYPASICFCKRRGRTRNTKSRPYPSGW